jgi:membrane protein required for colicin V production
MNLFDAVVYIVLAVAIAGGLKIGFLRSAITIFAYLVAMPVALAVMALIAPQAGSAGPAVQNWPTLFAVFLFSGMLFGKLMRGVLDEAIGPEAGMMDRIGGAMLGTLRVGLLAITAVLVFDRVIPLGREPAFLRGSQLRPLFSAAGQSGIKSLPPELSDLLDRLRGLQRT